MGVAIPPNLKRIGYPCELYMKVSEIMNKAIVIEEDINLRQAAKVMSDKNIGSLIVMKGEKIIGIITERDIMKNVNKLGEKISSVMSKEVITIEHNESLDNAAILMAEHKIKRLPVIKKNELVGIVTATDLLANSDSLAEDFLLE